METIYVSSISYNKTPHTFQNLAEETGYTITPVDETEDNLAKQLAENKVRAFVADIYPYTGALYEALPEGGVIARYGVGHDSIDKPKAHANGLHVVNTPGVLDNAVAEHACWMIGASARHLHTADRSTQAGEWAPKGGVEIRGRSVAIVGFGRIGQSLAAKLAHGFGMNVIAVDNRPLDTLCEQQDTTAQELKADSGYAEYTQDREQALAKADYVVLLLPVNPATTHIANKDFFAAMKPSAILVNSARGALVNENELFDALSSGQIAGAALDVFEVEPYQPQDAQKDLRTLDNILLTPHIGSNTEESNAAMATTAIRNIITVLEQGADACQNIVHG